MTYTVMACKVMTYIVMVCIVMANTVMAYIAMAYIKGAEIFTGQSGIWHLHHACLARYHMPPNTDCDP